MYNETNGSGEAKGVLSSATSTPITVLCALPSLLGDTCDDKYYTYFITQNSRTEGIQIGTPNSIKYSTHSL